MVGDGHPLHRGKGGLDDRATLRHPHAGLIGTGFDEIGNGGPQRLQIDTGGEEIRAGQVAPPFEDAVSVLVLERRLLIGKVTKFLLMFRDLGIPLGVGDDVFQDARLIEAGVLGQIHQFPSGEEMGLPDVQHLPGVAGRWVWVGHMLIVRRIGMVLRGLQQPCPVFRPGILLLDPVLDERPFEDACAEDDAGIDDRVAHALVGEPADLPVELVVDGLRHPVRPLFGDFRKEFPIILWDGPAFLLAALEFFRDDVGLDFGYGRRRDAPVAGIVRREEQIQQPGAQRIDLGLGMADIDRGLEETPVGILGNPPEDVGIVLPLVLAQGFHPAVFNIPARGLGIGELGQKLRPQRVGGRLLPFGYGLRICSGHYSSSPCRLWQQPPYPSSWC